MKAKVSAPRRLLRALVARILRAFRLDRSALVPSLAVLAIASIAGSVVGYRGYLWAWVDPEFCYLCHIHDYAVMDWRRSIHGEVVTCHDCHRVPLLHYTETLLHTFVDRPSYPEDLEELPHISSETCESCHLTDVASFRELSSPMPRWLFDGTVKIDQSPAHVAHMQASTRDPGEARGGEGGAPERDHRLPQHGGTAHDVGFSTGDIECIDCHGTEANRFHNFLARAANCLQCHEDLTVRGEHLADFDCKHCHFQDFLSPGDFTRGEVPTIALPIADPLIQ